MATVVFSSELQAFTGEASTEVKARVYRDLVEELLARYPKLDRKALTSMAVAIDDEIIVDPLLEPLGEQSEIHFLHFVKGG